MTLPEAAICGLVQGLTEFLPVSSSGHLVLIHTLFGNKEVNIFFDICLHVATLGAVLLYFRSDILALMRFKNVSWIFYIAIATIPAVLAAYFFEDKITVFFASPIKVAYSLIGTGAALFLAQLALRYRRDNWGKLTFFRSLSVGVAQAFALLPGLSRSGMTISTALVSGVKPEEAFKFSFLLSIPVIIGASLYKAVTLDSASVIEFNVAAYSLGMAISFIVGLASLSFLWRLIRSKKLYLFGLYCVSLAFLIIFLER